MRDRPAHAVRCLKDDDRADVWLIEPPGDAPRTLKRWRLTWRLAATMLIGLAAPQRQARGARWLAAAGVPTPSVTRGPRLVRSPEGYRIVVELEHVPGVDAMTRLAEGPPGPAAPTGDALGAVVASIAAAGFVHRDLKLRNIVLAADEDDGHVWVIDGDGVRRMTSRVHAIARMLERLHVEPSTEGVAIPACWRSVWRGALRNQPEAVRRAVRAQLQAHRRS